MNIGTANYVITRQIQNSNIPFKYQVNLPRNTPVGLPKAFQRKTNWKYWIKYIKPIWCPQQMVWVIMGWQGVILRMQCSSLTPWGRLTHIYVNELTIIGSDNGLLPGRRQAVIWNNAGLLWIEPLGTNFSEISIRIHFQSRKCTWTYCLRNDIHFVSASMC